MKKQIKKSIKRLVVRWIGEKEAENLPISVGGLGGWFGRDKKGQRWKDYINEIKIESIPYIEAIRENVIENNIRHNGNDHQNREDGIPLFDDGTIGSFSMRAWGDLMAAIWSTAENKDYNYIDFYC